MDFEVDGPELDIVFRDLLTDSVAGFGDLLGYTVSPTQFATVAGIRKPTTNYLYPRSEHDGIIFADIAQFKEAVYKPKVYASHSIENSAEYSICHCTYTTELIKHWLIDNEDVTFNGDESSLNGGFGLISNGTNPVSKSLRLIINGNDENGNELTNYNGIMSSLVTILKDNYFDIPYYDMGPAVGIDMSTLDDNIRVPGELRGSPIYVMNCPWSFEPNREYYSRIILYDMNGAIYPDGHLPYEDYEFNWSNASVPYVLLNSSSTVKNAFSSYNVTWTSNDIAVRSRLDYEIDGNSNLMNDDIVGSQLSYSLNRIPPLTKSKSTANTSNNLGVNFRLRFYLDDYNHYCDDIMFLPVSTPDWNPDNLSLVYQDEDSIKLAWTDNYNLVDRIMRTNDNPDFERDVSLNTYTDKGFLRGVNNNYEVHSKWTYPNGEILISENDNNTHKLTVYGIPCNAPKAYPIACIWQPNNKALLKWIDNSRQTANIGLL